MKKAIALHGIKKYLLILSFVLICVCLCSCGYFSEEKAEALKEYGEEMFMENDFENYRQSLRHCGLSDLDFDTYFLYELEEDFDSEGNHLTLTCHLDSFKSDKIDSYYQYYPRHRWFNFQIEEFSPLLHTMSSIWRAMGKSYTYKYDGKFTGYVTVNVREPYEFEGLKITASTGHVYRYRWSRGIGSDIASFASLNFKESYKDDYNVDVWQEDRDRP